MVSPFGLSGAAQAGALESYGKIYIYIYPVDFSINLNTALGELNLNNQVADSGIILLCARLAMVHVTGSMQLWQVCMYSFHNHHGHA